MATKKVQTIDFSAYENIEDLRAVIAQYEEEIKRRQEVGRQELIEEIQQRATALGISVEEFIRPARRKRSPQRKQPTPEPPKYRNPDDHTQTWQGTGRKPQWLKTALAQGAELSTFATNEP